MPFEKQIIRKNGLPEGVSFYRLRLFMLDFYIVERVMKTKRTEITQRYIRKTKEKAELMLDRILSAPQP